VFNTGAGATGNTYDVILDGALSWDAARAAAQAAGGDLATIDSAAESNFITTLLSSNNAPTGGYFFGLREATEGTYVPVTGAAGSFSNFAPNLPDNANGSESVGQVLWTSPADTTATDPAQLARSGQWNDVPPSGYPVNGIVVPPDVLRAGYLIEISAAVDPRGGSDDGGGSGGGATAIPLPAALYAFPVGMSFASIFYRRMRRSA
jgi:C-type mannose receptor